MRLTRFTEYTLRTLMYLALHPGGYVTIAEIATTYRLSTNHLMKVVQHLAAQGEIVTMRGQHGGLRLARPPEAIRLGQVVRRAEPDMELLRRVEGEAEGELPPACGIVALVNRARDAFIAALDEYTMADVIAWPVAELKAYESLTRC